MLNSLALGLVSAQLLSWDALTTIMETDQCPYEMLPTACCELQGCWLVICLQFQRFRVWIERSTNRSEPRRLVTWTKHREGLWLDQNPHFWWWCTSCWTHILPTETQGQYMILTGLAFADMPWGIINWGLVQRTALYSARRGELLTFQCPFWGSRSSFPLLLRSWTWWVSVKSIDVSFFAPSFPGSGMFTVPRGGWGHV